MVVMWCEPGAGSYMGQAFGTIILREEHLVQWNDGKMTAVCAVGKYLFNSFVEYFCCIGLAVALNTKTGVLQIR